MYEHKNTDVLTVEETATFLKVKPSTVRRLARQGHLTGRKIGKSWRFSMKTLIDWIEHKPKSKDTTEGVDNKCIDFTNDQVLTTGKSQLRSKGGQYENLLALQSKH